MALSLRLCGGGESQVDFLPSMRYVSAKFKLGDVMTVNKKILLIQAWLNKENNFIINKHMYQDWLAVSRRSAMPSSKSEVVENPDVDNML